MENTLTLNVAVCEDVPDDASLLLTQIGRSGLPAECALFESAGALLGSFRTGRYDLIFLDIYMNGESGLAAAKTIRETDRSVVLAFTTASLEHTLESYRVGALKYLEKPVKPEDVKETLELALAKRKARPLIAVTARGGRRVDIPLDDILYFEQQRHVVAVHTLSGVVITSQSVRMDALEAHLPSPPFFRCHRSFLINLDYVRRLERELHAFVMENGGRADIRRGGFGICEDSLKLYLMAKTGGDVF